MDGENLDKKQIVNVYGNAGTEHYNGYFSEEPNPVWRDQRRVEIVEEMRRGDGAVKAVLSAVKSPILSTNWFIEPASDEDKDKEIASDIEQQIFNMPYRTFDDFLRESLTHLDFGHAVFEKIYMMVNGKILIADLAPRIQSSIEKWEQTDGSPGIQQMVRNDDDKGEEHTFYFNIPWKKLLIFTNDKEGDDVTGQSVLRSAYIHYYMKNRLYKTAAIGLERNFIGIPTGKLAAGFGQSEKDEMEKVLKNIRANEQQFIVLPPENEFTITTPQGNPLGSTMKDTIDHHNRMILLAVLAEFLDLGAGSTGSFALSEDQQSFFLQHVEEKCKYVAQVLNNGLVKELVDLNYGKQKKYPKLKYAPLGSVDYSEISTMLKTLVDAGLIQADDIKIQQFTRESLKLPQLTEEEVEEMEEKKMEAELKAMEGEDIGGDDDAEIDAMFPDVEVDDVEDPEEEAA